jgi:hypothetical protein
MNKKFPTFFLTWFNKFLRVPTRDACKSYLKQPLQPFDAKFVLLIALQIIGLTSKLVGDRLSQSLGMKNYVNFHFENVVENEAHFVLECSLTTPLEIGFFLMLE